MSFCQTCGTSLPDGSPTCTACGATQGAAAAPGPIPGAIPGPIPERYPPPLPCPLPEPALPRMSPERWPTWSGPSREFCSWCSIPSRPTALCAFTRFSPIFFNLAWIGFWILWTIIGLMLGAVSHGLFFIIQLPINLLITVGGFCLWPT